MPIYRNEKTGHTVTVLPGTILPKAYKLVNPERKKKSKPTEAPKKQVQEKCEELPKKRRKSVKKSTKKQSIRHSSDTSTPKSEKPIPQNKTKEVKDGNES